MLCFKVTTQLSFFVTLTKEIQNK